MINTRKNTLKAIRLEKPDFIPVFDGTVWEAVALGGNFQFESFTDHWGVVWKGKLKGLVPVDVEHPLSDLSQIDNYNWPDPWALTWTSEDQHHLDAIDRHQTLVGGLQINFIFERLRSLIGTENFFTAFYDEPDRLQVTIDHIVEYQIVCIRRLIDLGVEIIHLPEDLGSTRSLLVSPQLLRKFIWPAYERCFHEIKQRGVLIDFHSDGAIEPIIPDLISLGIDILNPIEVQANHQLHVRDLVKGKIATLGAIDAKIVHTKSPEEVCREVHRAFDLWKDVPGWIAGPDQVLTGAPPDNVTAFLDVCWERATS